MAGDEVVQVYVRDQVATVAQPVKQLVAFRRITLQPGESTRVEFELGPEAFRIWDIDMREVIEPGTFDIMVGPDSAQLNTTQLDIRSAR